MVNISFILNLSNMCHASTNMRTKATNAYKIKLNCHSTTFKYYLNCINMYCISTNIFIKLVFTLFFLSIGAKPVSLLFFLNLQPPTMHHALFSPFAIQFIIKLIIILYTVHSGPSKCDTSGFTANDKNQSIRNCKNSSE